MYSNGLTPEAFAASLAAKETRLIVPAGRPAPIRLPPRGIFIALNILIVFHSFKIFNHFQKKPYIVRNKTKCAIAFSA
jgi:hypothetical protein